MESLWWYIIDIKAGCYGSELVGLSEMDTVIIAVFSSSIFLYTFEVGSFVIVFVFTIINMSKSF